MSVSSSLPNRYQTSSKLSDCYIIHHLSDSWNFNNINNMWQLFQELNFKFLELSVPWEKTSFFSPMGFDVQTNSGHKTQKIKLYSVRASKCFLNEKNLIHSQVMGTISKFSPRFLKHSLAGCPNGASLWMPYIILSVN